MSSEAGAIVQFSPAGMQRRVDLLDRFLLLIERDRFSDAADVLKSALGVGGSEAFRCTLYFVEELVLDEESVLARIARIGHAMLTGNLELVMSLLCEAFGLDFDLAVEAPLVRELRPIPVISHH